MKIFRGAGMFVASIFLAWLTHSAVSEQSISEYLSKEWPNAEMWQGYLRQRGFIPVTDSHVQARLLQRFVPIFGADPSVFMSEDACLIYLENSSRHSTTPSLWSCLPKPPRPRGWIRLGSGWAAFQRLPKIAQTPPKPTNKLSNSIDPKEIHY